LQRDAQTARTRDAVHDGGTWDDWDFGRSAKVDYQREIFAESI